MSAIVQGYGTNQRVLGQGYASAEDVVATTSARTFVTTARSLAFVAVERGD